MELHRFLQSRQSTRSFQAGQIPDDIIQRVLETASWAPSAHNSQPWRFAIIKSQQVKERLADAMGEKYHHDLLADGISVEEALSRVKGSRKRICEAPLVVVLCYDPVDMDNYPDGERQEKEHLMGQQSVALAGGTMLLAAHAEGLGAVWMCSPLFAPEAVIKVLKIPRNWQPQGMILLGYPGDSPRERTRRPLRELVHYCVE